MHFDFNASAYQFSKNNNKNFFVWHIKKVKVV